jgi:hypothetical protein
MIIIKNTNEAYGDLIEFEGVTLEEAVAEMEATIRACGPDFEDVIVTADDYEIVEE